jgi:Fungalysin metallopeptidase (M36)/FG-GAP-like repeat
MKKLVSPETRYRVMFSLLVLGLIAAVIILPNQFHSKAVSVNSKKNADIKIEDYDIRTDKNAADTLLDFRQTAGRDAVQNADARDKFVAAENQLRQSVPTLKIEYNPELQNPEVIAPDVLQGRAFLTSPTGAKRATVLRDFAGQNRNLIALTNDQINNLKTTADYSNPEGELSFARLEQEINGIPVFRSEIRAGFNKQGAMFRVINNLAPGLEYETLSKEFGNPADAVSRAAFYLNYDLKDSERTANAQASTDLKAVFGSGDWATTAEKMYFPVELGVARPSWRVLIWQPVKAYYVIVDAETGTMLYRENITKDQTQAATYNVYANSNTILKSMVNPSPLAAPGLIDPTLGTQGALQPRTDVTLIGNEAPNTFNNLGWITDGTNGVNGHTDGNNVQAGVDLVTPDGVDAPVLGVNRVFNFDYTPGAGTGATGDSPTLVPYRNGASVNLFYVSNRYHDETYRLGFTEQARNFQADNFGRGGVGADRVSAEAQDSSGTNNANFATPADGGRGRMQMYIWTAPNPDRDGDLDAEIIVHELTHGLFGRLHNGVGGTQAGQMNEGNSDFFAHVLLSPFTDPVNTISTTGSYSTLNLRTAAPFSNTGNYYYGIRRFPKAVIAFTGGPNNRPHNPMTFGDIDPARMSLTDGAFAPAFAGSATAVHDGGEIWSSMLWEIRARLHTRLGAEAANRKILQLVMDGMKVSPANPTMIQERNAILSAAQANGNGGDVADIWAGFAVRGMGFSATNPTGNTVTEGFDLPNATLAADGFVVSDIAPGGDGDGFPEPGETLQLTVPVVNSTGNTVNNVTAAIVGGGNANYGTITNGQTVSRQISYLVPANALCGSLHSVTINVSSDIGTQAAQTRTFRLGAPNFSGNTMPFDNVTAPALPDGWSQVNSGSNTGWVTSTVTPNSAPNTAFSPALATAGQADLTTTVKVNSATAQLTFKNFYNTESTWDGMVLDIQIGNGAFQDILAAGGTFVSGGYTTAMNAASPFGARQAWSGTAAAFVNTVVNLPATANNQIVNLRWRTATDGSVAATGIPGVKVDDVVVTDGLLLNGYSCQSVAPTSKARADFDGDGRTDVSVFRPSEGNWYLNRSTAGFTAATFGLGTDKLVPADYDGDGKTDIAVARPNAGNTAFIFYIFNSGNSTVSTVQWGAPTDIPQVGDYNNDSKADVAVFRPSDGAFYISNSGGGVSTIQFGQNGDVPVAADYDGDGRTDAAVVRNNVWLINKSTGGVQTSPFGVTGDKPVPADYNGDGSVDIAVYRPSNGTWYTSLNAANNYGAIQFGNATDVPVPGDYDGDGKTDVAVFRAGTWFINRSTAGFTGVSFGASSDLPIPKQYIP